MPLRTTWRPNWSAQTHDRTGPRSPVASHPRTGETISRRTQRGSTDAGGALSPRPRSTATRPWVPRPSATPPPDALTGAEPSRGCAAGPEGTGTGPSLKGRRPRAARAEGGRGRRHPPKKHPLRDFPPPAISAESRHRSATGQGIQARKILGTKRTRGLDLDAIHAGDRFRFGRHTVDRRARRFPGADGAQTDSEGVLSGRMPGLGGPLPPATGLRPYPLTPTSGSSLATFFARPAAAATSTTALTSL